MTWNISLKTTPRRNKLIPMIAIKMFCQKFKIYPTNAHTKQLEKMILKFNCQNSKESDNQNFNKPLTKSKRKLLPD
jgi:hypothetical protein